MRKIFLWIAVLLLAVCLVGCTDSADPSVAPKTMAELFDQAQKSVVRIDAAASTGSGIIASNNGTSLDIITNFHVIIDAYDAGEPISVYLHGSDTPALAQIVGFVQSYDICVLRAEVSVDNQPINLNAAKEEVGESVLAIGFNGKQIGAYNGIISTLAKRIYNPHLNKRMFVTQTTAPFAEGCSGGLLIDSQGNFLGLNSYALITSQAGDSLHTGLTYAIPREIVLAAYQRITSYATMPVQPMTAAVINADHSVTVTVDGYLFDVTEGNSGLVVGNSKSGAIYNGAIITKINGKQLNTAQKTVTFLAELLKTYDQTVFTFS